MNNNPKNAAWYGNDVGHLLVPGANLVYYVDTAANGALDANDGLTPATAFLTIDYAIGQCTGTNHDYIFVLGHDNGTETWPIVMDMDLVHLIGTPGVGRPVAGIRCPDDVDAVDVTADRCEIAGFYIETNSNAHTNRLIDCSGGGNWFHHNYLAWVWWGYDGIYFDGAGCSNNLVENNYFGAHGFGHWHIVMTPVTNRIVVRDNVFILNGYQTGNRCIEMDSNNRSVVKDNVFMVPDLAAGEAIYSETNTNFVTGNQVASGTIAMAFNPFRDLGANNWGLNYASGAPVLPVTV